MLGSDGQIRKAMATTAEERAGPNSAHGTTWPCVVDPSCSTRLAESKKVNRWQQVAGGRIFYGQVKREEKRGDEQEQEQGPFRTSHRVMRLNARNELFHACTYDLSSVIVRSNVDKREFLDRGEKEINGPSFSLSLFSGLQYPPPPSRLSSSSLKVMRK